MCPHGYIFIVQIYPYVQQNVQFTPLVLEHILLQAHLLWGELTNFCGDM